MAGRGFRTAGVLTTAAAVAASVLVTVIGVQTANAASLNSPPDRLYMSPTGTIAPPGVPVGSMPMIDTDPISGDVRDINVTAPNGPLGCNLQAPAWDIDDWERLRPPAVPAKRPHLPSDTPSRHNGAFTHHAGGHIWAPERYWSRKVAAPRQ